MKIKLLLASAAVTCIVISCEDLDYQGKVNQDYIDETTRILTEYSTNWSNAFKTKNGSSIEKYFAADMIYHRATGERLSKNELIVDIEEFPFDVQAFTLEDVQVQLFGKGLAVVTGGGSLSWLDELGIEQVYKSRFTNVWRKGSNDWLCIVGHGSPYVPGDADEDLVKIHEIPIKAAAAINSRNFEAWLDLFDENAQVMFRDQITISGKQQMKEKLSKFWELPSSDYVIKHVETRIMGDFAYGIGIVTGNDTDIATRKSIKVNSRETVIFRKQDNGDWKVFRLMVNANQ